MCIYFTICVSVSNGNCQDLICLSIMESETDHLRSLSFLRILDSLSKKTNNLVRAL